jgi:hypothetical protein
MGLLLFLLWVHVQSEANSTAIRRLPEECDKEPQLSPFPLLDLFGKTTATLRSGQLADVEYHIRFQPTTATSPRDVLSEIKPHLQFLVRAWASVVDETTITSHSPLWHLIESEVRSLLGNLEQVRGYARLNRAAATAPARVSAPRPNTKPHQFTFGDDRRVTLDSDDTSHQPSIEAIQLLDPTELE